MIRARGLALAAVAAQPAACSFVANLDRRPQPGGMWRDPACANDCSQDHVENPCSISFLCSMKLRAMIAA